MSFISDDLELLEEFIAECADMLDEIEPIFIDLGNTQDIDTETVNKIFRVFHSIKGSAGFLNFNNIAEVTHNAETLLDAFRNTKMEMSQYFLDVLLSTVDALRKMLDVVASVHSDEAMSEVNKKTSGFLMEAIEKTKQESFDSHPPSGPPKEEKLEIKLDDDNDFELEISLEMAARFAQESGELLDKAEESLLKIEKSDPATIKALLDEAFRAMHSFKGNCGFMQLGDFESLSHATESILDCLRQESLEASETNIDILLQTLDTLRKGLSDYSANSTTEIPNCPLLVEFLFDCLPSEGEKEKEKTPESLEQTLKVQTTESQERKAEQKTVKKKDVRVDVEKLDSLINLIGELVIAESMVLGNKKIAQIEDEELERSIHHLQRISSNLQDVAMSVRMVPLAGTFKKMIRLVHDLGRKSGKKAEVVISGEDTEVDKNVIEEISDPIVHIIRNSIDHGLEAPDERKKKKKTETGKISITAKHESGEVWISISDDGKGLDREKILEKARRQGLAGANAENLPDSEVFAYIFEPGFSTAEKITDISGRGVGMDVVKKNIEKLNGKISIKSEQGKGASIILQLPLTLAIIDGMLIRSGESLYTMPLLSIRESIVADPNKITVTPGGVEHVLVRDEIIPVLRLNEIYKNKSSGEKKELEKGVLVIVESDSETAALFVDEIIGQQEIVIKGLSKILGSVRGVSGCTVLGNGEVSLITDVGGLIRRASGK